MLRTRLILLIALASIALPVLLRAQTSEPASPPRLVLDMVHNNPGEPPTRSAFNDPKRLADWGYTGQVVNSLVEGIATFDAIDPALIPAGSRERAWADNQTRLIAQQIKAAHAAGEKCYAWMQVLVLPNAVIAREHDKITNAQGRIDIALPATQELFRAQLREIFKRLPDLDGLVVRTGEIYLQDLPYHAASPGNADATQGGTAIVHGPDSHIDILRILREEVAVTLNRVVIYRTWDFGNNFHTNPRYYLKVTSALEPHPNLFFSIKHQAGDFHQLTPFNPTLAIGRHRQIVEVQCQREAYGKGAYPYYIGEGVINGWEEYAWMMKPTEPHGLRDIVNTPQFAGVWTWSRGGGWDGPYIHNELWCELNAYVIAKFVEDPTRTELDIFDEFSRKIGLTGDDIARFRQLNLLSTQAVLRGQLTTLKAKIDLWWARDDTLSAPDLRDFIRQGLVEKAIDEKRQAVTIWQQMEALARQIHFPGDATQRFVITSVTYGRIKYDIIAQGWTVLLLGQQGDATGIYDKPRMTAAINAYDRLWDEWRVLKQTHPECSTLSTDLARGGGPGIGAAIDKYRKKIEAP